MSLLCRTNLALSDLNPFEAIRLWAQQSCTCDHSLHPLLVLTLCKDEDSSLKFQSVLQ